MARQREKLTDTSSTAGKGLEDLKPRKRLLPTDRAVVRPMLRWPVTVEIPVSTNQKGHPAPRFGCCLCPYSVWKPDQLLQCQRWSSARAVPSGEPEPHQLRPATAQSRQALGAYSGKRGGQGWPFNHGRCPHPLQSGGSIRTCSCFSFHSVPQSTSQVGSPTAHIQSMSVQQHWRCRKLYRSGPDAGHVQLLLIAGEGAIFPSSQGQTHKALPLNVC